MDFASVLNKNHPHQRTIVHLDMDYYYAQVEEIRDPNLKTQPLGVQQKNFVVTCNYVARKMGVTKLMSLTEALRLCPTLVLVNGEDLTPYRHTSQKIFELLLNYTPMVEKLGFDEDFLDVSQLVELRQQQMHNKVTDINDGDEESMSELPQVAGHIYPAGESSLESCDCGCAQRLAIGTQIAKEIREDLLLHLGITCCAGVSYNKLLAKLVGSQNKPNQQTVLVSMHAEQFMRELKDLSRITGIGQKTAQLLQENGITNVEELQRCDMDFLRKKLGFETATKLKDLSFGRDTGIVRTTGKPKSIGLEDSCRPISVRNEVEERFRMLLLRLLEQVAEDGRIPITIKVVLRKFDSQKKTSHRETKQANILPSLFKATPCADTGRQKITPAEGAQGKLLKIIMRLFERVVDMNKPFNITLIGLAFSKFQQRKVGSSSIANFLIKKTDLEVQSVTSLINTSVSPTSESSNASNTNASADEAFRSSPTTFQPSDQFYRRRTTAASPIPMLVDNGSESGATNSDFSDFSETEVEPSPKKSRISRLIMNRGKRHCLGSSSLYTDSGDVASPSKLRVCDLRLNSRDSEKDFPISSLATSPSTSHASPLAAMSMRRFHKLVNRYESTDATNDAASSTGSPTDTPLSSPVDEMPFDSTLPSQSSPQPMHTNTTTITGNLANIPCPAGVDPQVFSELPLEVQNELIASWRSSLAAAVVANNSATQTATGSAPANGAQKNTLYRYFLRNK